MIIDDVIERQWRCYRTVVLMLICAELLTACAAASSVACVANGDTCSLRELASHILSMLTCNYRWVACSYSPANNTARNQSGTGSGRLIVVSLATHVHVYYLHRLPPARSVVPDLRHCQQLQTPQTSCPFGDAQYWALVHWCAAKCLSCGDWFLIKVSTCVWLCFVAFDNRHKNYSPIYVCM